MDKPWKVVTVKLTKEALSFGSKAQYLFHVTGYNFAADPEVGETFSWTIPSISGGYDFSACRDRWEAVREQLIAIDESLDQPLDVAVELDAKGVRS